MFGVGIEIVTLRLRRVDDNSFLEGVIPPPAFIKIKEHKIEGLNGNQLIVTSVTETKVEFCFTVNVLISSPLFVWRYDIHVDLAELSFDSVRIVCIGIIVRSRMDADDQIKVFTFFPADIIKTQISS